MILKSQTLFNTAFFVLFPLFFIYHVMVAKYIIPPFLGGYFTFSVLLSLPFLIIGSFLQSNQRKTSLGMGEVLFFLLLVYFSLITLVNFIFNPILNGTLTINSTLGALYIFVCYIIGRFMNLHNETFKKIIILTLLIFLLIIVNNLNQYATFCLSKATNTSISYQGYARTLVVLGFLSIAMIKNLKYSIAIYFLASIALFLNGARTEFVLFVLSGLLYYIFLKFKLIIPIIIVSIIIILIFLLNDTIQQFILHNRFFELLTNPENSTSKNARLQTIILALQTISEHPVLGDYGSYVKEGGIGWYAHSIVSAWVDLGFFGFFLYFVMFFVMFAGLITYKNKQNTVEYRLYFLFYIYVFIAMMLSKNYLYMLFGFLVAFYARTINAKQT